MRLIISRKTAPWGLPELQLDDVAAELMDIVEVQIDWLSCGQCEESGRVVVGLCGSGFWVLPKQARGLANSGLLIVGAGWSGS